MQILRFLRDSAKNVGYVLFYIFTQMVQLTGVVLISIWNGAPWQCVAICLGFLLAKHYSGSKYHAKSMIACSIITWISFYFLTAAVPPLYISITIPGVMGIALAFVTSWLADLMEGRK